MQSIPTQKKLTSEQSDLLKLFTVLDKQNQASLLAFAEFLAKRNGTSVSLEPKASVPLQPKPITRPAKESVVKAIKRLSSTYYMLERDKMLDDTSSLMMAHVIQGRDAASVINDLEKLFKQHYQRYLDRY